MREKEEEILRLKPIIIVLGIAFGLGLRRVKR
jgi:hypothetical protein